MWPYIIFPYCTTGSRILELSLNVPPFIQAPENRRQKSTSYFPYIMYNTKKIRTYRDVQYGKNTASGCTIRKNNVRIILIELKYIVSVPFNWTRTLSPIFFYSFITRWTFQSASRNYEDPPSWKREILQCHIYNNIYK
jgi:hypothetical protein